MALPPSAEVIVAMLAVLKAGAAYLPIDLSYPAGRVGFMLADARPSCLITQRAASERLNVADVPMLLIDDAATSGLLASVCAAPVADEDRVVPAAAGQMAYVMYTSGSTGTPKAVIIEHRALGDYLTWSKRTYPSLVGASLWHSSVSFDQTITSLWSTLVCGGQVLVGALVGGGHAASPALRLPQGDAEPPVPA